MSFCGSLARILGVVLLCAATQIPALAQMTIVGRISGTVVDTSNAAIAGATIAATDESTGISRTATTDNSGFYVLTNLPVGSYRVSAERQGFGKQAKSGYRLDADGRITVDFALKPGTVTQTVEVVASGETVNTVSGEISRVVDMNQVQDLALNGRNYIQLVSLVPGVALIDEDQMAVTTSLSATNQSVNGTRTDQNHLTVDGGFDLDSGSNGSQINNVGVDFIQEVSIKTSNFSAEYGRNSGGSINAVTRSGGKNFHGTLLEFFRNDKLDAMNFFAPTGLNGQPQKNKLRFNNFGWNLGGPIPIFKDKLFFFVGEEWKILRQTTAPSRTTGPTSAQLAGNFSAICLNGFDATGVCLDRDKSSKVINQLYCPGKNGVAASAIKGNLFSNAACAGGPTTLSPDGQALAKLFTAMEQPQQGAFFQNIAKGNNLIFQVDNPFNWREDIARIDFVATEKQRLHLRYLHDEYDITLPFGFSCGGSFPTCQENRLRPGTSYQLGHQWILTPTLVNEATINAAWNGQRIPPVGTAWERSTYGFVFPQIFPNGGGRFRNSIPDITVSGTCGALPVNAPAGAVSAACPGSIKGQAHSLLSPTTDITANETLTWTHGAHTLKGGVAVVRNRKDQNSRSDYAGNVTFTTSNSTNTTGNSLADALLGNFQDYKEASDDPTGHFRYTQYHGFVMDNWKVLRNLSLEAGVRYTYAMPTYTQANNFTNFDPSLYDPTQAVTILTNGNIDLTKGGNRLNGMIRAGTGVPSDQLVNVPIGNSPAVLAVPPGAPRGLYHSQGLVAPRFGFAYSPFSDGKTSIRGGFGIFYDTPEGNMDFDELSNPPFATTVDLQNGSLNNPSGGKPPAAAPVSISAVDPHLKTAYTMMYSTSIQHELPYGVFFEMSYVGNETRHLIRKPDINQPGLAALIANAAIPSASRPSVNTLRPFKGYTSINMFISDATSNYNAFQAHVTKRKGNLMVTGSYTWSKALTSSGGGNNDVRNSGGNDNIQDFVDRFVNYGPAPFDRRHIFVATYSYNVPFFRSQQGFVGHALGGWEFSGITRAQTGQPFTVTGTSSGSALGRRRADFIGGDINISNPTPDHWFNTTAFAAAPDTRLGNSFPGVVRGPGLYTWDLSFRKVFNIQENWKLRFQTDFFNAFNHPNFRFDSLTSEVVNNTNINDGSFGTVSAAGPARNIQFGLKLTF
jgi:hypothetical protein